jgi:hypothetical protein
LLSRRLSLLGAVLVAVFSLSSCCVLVYIPILCKSGNYSVKAHPKPGQSDESAQAASIREASRVAKTIERVSDREFARRMGMQANPTSTQTVAPFYGNQTVVGTSDDSFMLVRQTDCSLTLGEFNGDYSNGTTTITVTNTTPNYEKVIHDDALLSTTPGAFPHGCGSTQQGAASANFAYLGQEKNNGPYVGAVLSGNSILTSSISSSYTVTTGATLTPDVPPFSITAADLNKDGNLDLISINTNGLNSSVTVYLNNGDGTFATGVNYDLPSTVISWAVADDLDGDGNVDVLTNAENGGFIALFGKGDGSLKTPAVSLITGGQTGFFADKFITADVNGDKKRDIVTSAGQLFLNSGDGITYTPSQAFPGVVNATNGLAPGIVAADFNNDGKLDIATDSGATISTYLGDGTGAFTVGPAYATIGNRGLITGTDIDGDGNLDLWSGAGGDLGYAGDDYIMNQGYALMGNGDGTFVGAPVLPFNYTGTNVLDLNGDGRPDLVGSRFNGTGYEIDTYLTNASGFPVAGSSLAVASGVQVDSYVLGAFDTNSNSTPGLIYLNAAPQIQSFFVAAGNGDGSFQAPVAILVPSLVPSGVDVNESVTGLRTADFNHDGKLDLAYSFSDEDSVSQMYYEGFAVQLGNGDGTFQAPKITVTYQSATAPTVFPSNMLSAIYDVNKDNFPDVVMVMPTVISGGEAQHSTLLFVGNGDGTFKAPNTITVTPNIIPSAPDGSYGSPLAFADLNGDGKIDLVASGSSSDGTTPQVAIALGNGDGTFQPPTILTFNGFGFAGTLALADFDGDGKIDMLVEGGTEATGNGIFPGNGDGTFKSISNGDGTVSAVNLIPLAVGNSAGAVDFNHDGLPDIIAGGVILINKSNVTPPTQAATSTALTSSLNPSTVGASVKFTATVTSTKAGTITGSVNFLDGSTSIGTGTVGAGGVATYSTTTLTQATHSITAMYGGDANYATSTSSAVSQVVNAAGGTAASSTTVTSSLNPSTVGASVTFTATVAAAAPTGAKPSGAQATPTTPTGTVTFKDGSTTLGTGTLTAGSTTFMTSALAQGTHSITAVYGGDSDYSTSTSPVLSQVVNAATSKAATSTALASSLNPSTAGANVVFTATVTSTTPGTITGTVSFFDGSTLLRNATIGTGGRAIFQSTTLEQGTHVITAQYLGDSTTYAGSTSPGVSQVVNASNKAATATALSASSTNAPAGTNITFTATVTSTTAGTISGNVAFLDGGTQIGTGTVGTGGVATYQTSTLAAGSHTITASYGGDTNYAGSTSSATQVTITSSGGSFTVSSNPSTVTVSANTPATSQITVSPTGGFSAPVTFACTGALAYSCSFSPATVTPNGGPASTTVTISAVSGSGVRRQAGTFVSAGGKRTGGAANSGGALALAVAHPFRFAFVFGAELLALALLATRRKRGLRLPATSASRLAYAVLLCAVVITAMAGCSGGGGPVTNVLTVNATSGSTVVSTTITVNFSK